MSRGQVCAAPAVMDPDDIGAVRERRQQCDELRAQAQEAIAEGVTLIRPGLPQAAARFSASDRLRNIAALGGMPTPGRQ